MRRIEGEAPGDPPREGYKPAIPPPWRAIRQDGESTCSQDGSSARFEGAGPLSGGEVDPPTLGIVT
jgi:hypothetical protein